MNELIEKIRKAPIADCDGKDQDCINCGEQEFTIYTICTKQVKIFLTQIQPYIEAKIEQARKDERERIIKIINKTYAYNCDDWRHSNNSQPAGIRRDYEQPGI